MFNIKRDTVYVCIILLVMFGAMLGGMDEQALTVLFFVLWGVVWLHKRHTEKEEFEEEQINKKIKKQAKNKLPVVILLLFLSACTSTNFQQYTDIDTSQRSITVPHGAKGLKGEIKKALSDAGWRLSVYRGATVMQGSLGDDTRLEQFETFNTRYTLSVASRQFDVCFDFSPAINYEISMVDNVTGAEVITMDGRDCERKVLKLFLEALNSE